MKLLIQCLDMRDVAFGVFRAIAPLLMAAVVFSTFPWVRRNAPLPPGTLQRLFRGGVITFFGLTFFLHGVDIGFLPVGTALGAKLASIWDGFALVPFGFILGLTVCAAEPMVSVLCEQVEEATAGTVPRKLLFVVLAIGVALAIALSMLRLLYGWPVLWLIAPGYICLVALSCVSSATFVPVAYDASSVVTGPMVATFVMALALGAAGTMENRDPLLDGFGLVALVAMVPMIAVMFVGFLHRRQGSKQ